MLFFNRSSFFFVALFLVFAGASAGEEGLPLKGEVRTNRSEFDAQGKKTLPKDSDPFSDDSTADDSTLPGATEYGVARTTINPHPVNAKVDLNYQKGFDAEQRGDLATAIENYVVAVNNDPSNREFLRALRRAELKFKSNYPTFHAYTSYFTAKHDARLLLNYGVRLYSLSCFQQAERLFNRAASLDSSNPNAYFNLGVIYEHDGRLAKALPKYQKALALFKAHGPDLPASAQSQARSARDKPLTGAISKSGHERRRYSGMEDPLNGRALAQAAVNSVLQQMKGKRSDVPKWPMLDVTQREDRRTAAATRHVDTCDHCLILRNVEMWPN